MVTISYAIVGHHQRTQQAQNLSAQLGGCPIALDDGTIGQGTNHDRAWVLATTTPADYCCVLEDDAIPVTNFHQQTQAALAVAPTPIISLYLGRTRPPQYQPAIQGALTLDTDWITARHLFHAVAVAIRSDLVGDMLSNLECASVPADDRIGHWAQKRNLLVSYTNPSLVEHDDGPTLIAHADGQPRVVGRRAWRAGTRFRWSGSTTAI